MGPRNSVIAFGAAREVRLLTSRPTRIFIMEMTYILIVYFHFLHGRSLDVTTFPDRETCEVAAEIVRRKYPVGLAANTKAECFPLKTE